MVNKLDWLPTTRKEMELRGWDQADVILFSGDAYVDHPAFGVAVIGRLLEAEGLRVCIVPQPDWHGDFRDFRKLGRPRLFFGISPGCMDSMVNKYTAARRLRSEDAYSPDGRHDLRPEYPTIVYTDILRKLYPDVPIVLGGIEASLRRVMHYDYWQERFRPSILCDCDADLITYGMGEKPTLELVRLLMEAINDAHPMLHYDENGEACITREVLRDVAKELPQTVFLCKEEEIPGGIRQDDIVLHSYEDCLRQPRLHAENFRHIEEESNKIHAHRLLQMVNGQWSMVNPPYPPLTSEELDRSFDLPYTRLPHPKYKGKRIPAYEMIRFSVTLHRGCFGGCAFCTISAHQGKFIVSRSKESILKEVKAITQMPDFKGYLSDLGGPSANMYMMQGKRRELCEKCKRPSCIHPAVCPNLNGDHRPLLDISAAVSDTICSCTTGKTKPSTELQKNTPANSSRSTSVDASKWLPNIRAMLYSTSCASLRSASSDSSRASSTIHVAGQDFASSSSPTSSAAILPAPPSTWPTSLYRRNRWTSSWNKCRTSRPRRSPWLQPAGQQATIPTRSSPSSLPKRLKRSNSNACSSSGTSPKNAAR